MYQNPIVESVEQLILIARKYYVLYFYLSLRSLNCGFRVLNILKLIKIAWILELLLIIGKEIQKVLKSNGYNTYE